MGQWMGQVKVRYGNHMPPIPGMDQTYDTYDSFYNRAIWKLKFLWLPKRCALSNHWLWLCWAYQGLAVWTGPGTPVLELRYHGPVEHIIWKLKQ
jgi:hypothetical protein